MKFQMFASSALLFLMFTFVSGQYEKEVLLELRNNLTYRSSSSTKLAHWDESSDFCQWPGVKCDSKNRVLALDLSRERISGGINDASSSLFKLVHLHNLSLAENRFDSGKFSLSLPSGFGRLSELRYLNLSNSGFSGQVPSDFSNLKKLVVLDLSHSIYPGLELVNPNLTRLIHNFIELTELYLDGVNISANGIEWANAISSFLPNLRVLSLRNCYITGPFHSSLLKLKSLSVIHLDYNSFSSPFPYFFADFSNLRVLTARSCDLTGVVPAKLFQVESLQTIDLYSNSNLEGSLPEFPGNVELSYVDLSVCSFSGPVPTSIKNLNHLVYLDLSSNNFSASLPSFASLKNLRRLYLFDNRLSGQIPGSHWKGLDNLEVLDLSDNSLQGEIPASLFDLPLLNSLSLFNNNFSGSITIPTPTSSALETLLLRSNSLEGPIPRSLFQLRNLSSLHLSQNKFTGSLNLTGIPKMENLVNLHLSHNDLSVHVNEKVSISSLFPRLGSLHLASCKLQRIPFLKNQSSLMALDLSDNQLEGEIPNWIWKFGNGDIYYMNLSHNGFTHLQEPYDLRSLYHLDLHSNSLGGEIPLPPNAGFIDLSSNNFSSSLPPNIGDYLHYMGFISLADNNIIGLIPSSFCNATKLEVLVLSNNRLSGGIPSCLFGKPLSVLNLRENNLGGDIPDNFPAGCSLETLDLSRNALQGKVPTSLSRCTGIKVVNLGNNALNDTFPCWLNNSSTLRVLALPSNKFHGNINCLGGSFTWPNLQIISLASNNINGVIPVDMFSNLQALAKEQQKLDHLQFLLSFINIYYQDSVSVTLKGKAVKLEKILTIFTSIDLSDNNLHGPIPQTIGEAKSLYLLNFSHNALSGHIPPSIQNLKQLGSFDLSFNNLDGEIPTQLASLTFLTFLNLSYNHLVGRIPQGGQTHTFPESFIGNIGLCGLPLNKTCNGGTTASPAFAHEREDEASLGEMFASVAWGFLVGLGLLFGPLFYSMRWRRWYDSFVKRIVLLVLHKKNHWRLNEDW